MAARKRRASRTTSGSPDRRRKRRPRPTPKWLAESKELDEIARQRCLMILSTLSGEKSVSEVIEELGLSRGTYYQLEQKALEAMLAALVPGTTEHSSAGKPQRRIAELEQKVLKLERAKRRAERMLHLTRQLIPGGRVTTTRGRSKSRKPRKSSKKPGSDASTRSPNETTQKPSPKTGGVATSIPTPAGAVER